MLYNSEKYREKREKVLGVRKRTISFGMMALVVAATILMGLGAVVIPKSIAYWQNRNLDDAIYKLPQESSLSAATMTALMAVDGVSDVVVETGKGRVVITYDRASTNADALAGFFKKHALPVTLLNSVGHAHRMALLEKEAGK